jgi:hypothetical protein
MGKKAGREVLKDCSNRFKPSHASRLLKKQCALQAQADQRSILGLDHEGSHGPVKEYAPKPGSPEEINHKKT